MDILVDVDGGVAVDQHTSRRQRPSPQSGIGVIIDGACGDGKADRHCARLKLPSE